MSNHEQRVRDLIAQGNKIEAIRVLREATHVGLAEAKAAVEQLERSGALPAQAPPAKDELPQDVVDLARQGKTLEAIRLLRERRSMSLREAKSRVDRVPLDPGVRKRGCLGAVLAALGAGAAILGG